MVRDDSGAFWEREGFGADVGGEAWGEVSKKPRARQGVDEMDSLDREQYFTMRVCRVRSLCAYQLLHLAIHRLPVDPDHPSSITRQAKAYQS
jgi:hypothetical protein